MKWLGGSIGEYHDTGKGSITKQQWGARGAVGKRQRRIMRQGKWHGQPNDEQQEGGGVMRGQGAGIMGG